MAEISKQALKVENNTQFPNNNNGQITPSRLRGFNTDMIDSLVDEISYNADSASFNQRIIELDPSASAQAINNLELFSASADARLDALEAATSSYANSASVAAVDNTQNQRLDSLESFTASLDVTYVTQAELAAATGALEDSIDTKLNTSSFDAFSQSIDSRVDALEAFSTSLDTNFASQTEFEAFTQSIQAEVDDIQAKTGSFATTGSNAFLGNQTITGSVTISGSAQSDLTVVGQIFVSSSATAAATAPRITVSGSAGRTIIQRNFITIANTTDEGGMFPSTLYAKDSTTTDEIGFTVDPSVFSITGWSSGGAIYINNPTDTYPAVIGFQNKANYTDGRVTILTPLSASAGFTASLQNGYTWVGNSLGENTQVPTASLAGVIPAGTISGSQQITDLGFVSSSITASTIVTASASNATITFTKGDASTFSVTVATGSAVSASYAETASLAINAETASLAINAYDVVVEVKNTTGGQLNKGTVVRIIGAVGDSPLIATASWEDDSTSANTLGFVVTDIPNDGFGRVMTQGKLLSVNTDPALGYAAGQLLYLSSSGQFSNVKPPAPYHEVRLGQVLRAQQNNGSIYVLVQNGYELEELHDVNINTGSLVDRDILAYNSASGQWENQTANELGLATTGSNTFIGNQTITGSLYLTGSNSVFRGVIDVPQFLNGELQNVIRFYQGTSGSSASSKLQFYSGSYESPNTGFVNLQSNPFNGALAISAWPANNHFVDFDIATTSSIFTAPLAGAAASPIANTLVVRTNLTVSGSTTIALRVSSSAAGGGVGLFNPLALTFTSGSTNQITANYGRNGVSLTDTTGAPTTVRLVGMAQNPSLLGAPTVVGYTSPSIIAMNSGSQPEPVISFEHRGNYTNGQVTMVKNTRFLSGSITSGSALITGSLNVTGDSSFTGSMNFLSGSASGSVITNVGDTFTGSAAVTKIISLTAAEYAALGTKDPNTLYITV